MEVDTHSHSHSHTHTDTRIPPPSSTQSQLESGPVCRGVQLSSIYVPPQRPAGVDTRVPKPSVRDMEEWRSLGPLTLDAQPQGLARPHPSSRASAGRSCPFHTLKSPGVLAKPGKANLGLARLETGRSQGSPQSRHTGLSPGHWERAGSATRPAPRRDPSAAGGSPASQVPAPVPAGRRV